MEPFQLPWIQFYRIDFFHTKNNFLVRFGSIKYKITEVTEFSIYRSLYICITLLTCFYIIKLLLIIGFRTTFLDTEKHFF